jgi:hypothetical protein
MHMSEVKAKAEGLGIKPGRMGKIDLIHAIQNKEGNFPCFQTGLEVCDQFNCCWRNDCLLGSATESKKESKKEAYLRKMKVELKNFNDEIDNLKVKAKKMVGKSKSEALEAIKRLEKKCDEEIKLKIHEVIEVGEGLWQPTKKSIDSSWKDLKKAFQETLSKIGRMKP